MSRSKQQLRQARKRARQQSRIDAKEAAIRVQKQFLSDLGVWRALKPVRHCLPLGQRGVGKIRIRLTEGSSADAADGDALQTLQGYVDRLRFQPQGCQQRYGVQDYVSLLSPLALGLAEPMDGEGQSRIARLRRFVQELVARYLDENSLDEILNAVVDELDLEALRLSEPDGKQFVLQPVEGRDAAGRTGYEIRLRSYVAERRLFRLHYETRVGFRCSTLGLDRNSDWIQWSSALVQAPGPPQDLPVYIQKHALQRILAADGRFPGLSQKNRAALQRVLAASLQRPVLTPQPHTPGTWLVSFGHDSGKLGYLVATALPDAILIRTFLFLTMDGTPEGDRLSRRLRARRIDKQFLGLDRLDTLIDSDIGQDPVLREILRDCGCDHLFEVCGVNGELKTGQAAEIRRYFRLDDVPRSRNGN